MQQDKNGNLPAVVNCIARVAWMLPIVAGAVAMAFGQTNALRESPEMPVEPPVIQPGNVTQAVALQNRQAIEGGSVLPANSVVLLDSALTLKSGQTLDGNGATIKNAYSSLASSNASAHAWGGGVGYADVITIQQPARVTINDPSAAENYQLGGVAYFFKYDSYTQPGGPICQRRNIVAKSGQTLTLSSSIDPRCDRAKWFTTAAPITQEVRLGQSAVSVPTENQARQFKPGDWVIVTAGPDFGNSDHCEWDRVVAVNQFSVQLAWPTVRAYRTPVIAKVNPVANVTIRNVTFDQPVNPQAGAFFGKYSLNWRFENCVFNGAAGFSSSYSCSFINCRFTAGDFGFGSSHGCTVVGCTAKRYLQEEGCFDNVCIGCSFGPAPIPLQTQVGCERLTFRSIRVTGATDNPVAMGGSDFTVDDIDIDGGVTAYFSGQRLRLSRVKSTVPVAAYGGAGIVVQDVQSPQTNLGWVDGTHSVGVAMNVANPLKREGVWRLVP